MHCKIFLCLNKYHWTTLADIDLSLNDSLIIPAQNYFTVIEERILRKAFAANPTPNDGDWQEFVDKGFEENRVKNWYIDEHDRRKEKPCEMKCKLQMKLYVLCVWMSLKT